jgi:hypothetical protein
VRHHTDEHIVTATLSSRRSSISRWLSQYVAEGEEELGTDKRPIWLDLKYGSPIDAVRA